MIKKLITVFVILCGSLCAQDGDVKGLEVNMNITVIDYYNYKIAINSNPKEYFTAHLESVKDGKVVFETDSTFSDYLWHRVIDMNDDGTDELVLAVSEGASPYIYNLIYIFDASKGAKPLGQIYNGSLDTTVKGEPKIAAYTRMSPMLLGLGYNWLVEYKNGGLKYFDAEGTPWKKTVKPDVSSLLENLTQYEDFSEKCSDDNYKSFFESYLIQAQIYGNEDAALKFIDKYYKCPDKKNGKQQIIDVSAETFEWLTNPATYKYAE